MTHIRNIEWKHEVEDYLFITFGLLLYAVGWTVFLLPYEIPSGGLAGVSALIFYTTGLEMQVSYLIANAFLLLIAMKILGLKFCIKTIYAVLVLTFFLWALQRFLLAQEGEGATHLPRYLGDDQGFMAVLFGSSICGMGLAQCFLHQGSTGGTDIIAAMVTKYRHVSLGRMLLYLDIFIVGASYPLLHDWQRLAFGFVDMFVCNFMLDYVMNYVQQSVQFFIITKKPQEIYEGISTELERSATLLPGTGCFSGQPVSVLMVIVKKSQSVALFRLIKAIDPTAFISQTKAEGVYGEGFAQLK